MEPARLTLSCDHVAEARGSFAALGRTEECGKMHATPRIAILTALTLLPWGAAIADTPRSYDSFPSLNRRFELRLTSPHNPSGQIWSLIELRNRQVLYTVEAPFEYRYVVVSDDGRGLAALDYFPDKRPTRDTVLLDFYDDGRRVASYSFGELVPNVRYVAQTMSHFLWFTEMLPGRGSGKLALVDGAGNLTLTTLDLTTHVFDLRSGRLLLKQCYGGVPVSGVALSGPMRLLPPAISGASRRRFLIQPRCALCGAAGPPAPVEFDVPHDFKAPPMFEWLLDQDLRPNAEHWATVVVRDGHLVSVLDLRSEACQ